MFSQRNEWNSLAGGLKGKRRDVMCVQALEGGGGGGGDRLAAWLCFLPQQSFGMQHMGPLCGAHLFHGKLHSWASRVAFNTSGIGENTLTLGAVNTFAVKSLLDA